MSTVEVETRQIERDLTFSAEQRDLAEAAEGFAAARWTASPRGESTVAEVRQLWGRVASELGIVALAVPGHEGTLTDLCVVASEWGKVGFPAPLVTQAALVAPELAGLATAAPLAEDMLAAVLSGDRIVAPVVRPSPGLHIAEVDSSSITVSAVFETVPDGQLADDLLVRLPVGDHAVWAVVEMDAKGVERRRLNSMDPTRLPARVSLDDASLRVLGPANPIPTSSASLICLSAELAGTAEWALAMAVRHVLERKQFGRVVGGFQGVKHRLARMLVKVEAARAVWIAAAVADASAEVDQEARERALESVLFSAEAGTSVTADLIGLLGAIGFTRDHPAHLAFRRARAGRMLLGDPKSWQQELDETLLYHLS